MLRSRTTRICCVTFVRNLYIFTACVIILTCRMYRGKLTSHHTDKVLPTTVLNVEKFLSS